VAIIDGATETYTYTQTLTAIEALPTYFTRTEQKPDVTVTDNDVEYITITTYFPVTCVRPLSCRIKMCPDTNAA
jgi:hypothetical protein